MKGGDMPHIWIVPNNHAPLIDIFRAAGWDVTPVDSSFEDRAHLLIPDVAVYVIEQEALPDRFGLFCELKIMPVLAVVPNWNVAQQAIDTGADDVILAPINLDELLLRAHKLLVQSKYIRVGAMVIDLITGKVQVSGEIIPLSPIESQVLNYLAQNVGEVVGYDELLDKVWKCDPRSGGTQEQVKAAVKRLRHKIESDPRQPQYVVAVKKVGYRLRSQRQWEEELGFRGPAL
jgi:DNA-binding response OmpR family regulator